MCGLIDKVEKRERSPWEKISILEQQNIGASCRESLCGKKPLPFGCKITNHETNSYSGEHDLVVGDPPPVYIGR